MPERIDGGRALAAVGGVALLISLFLDWYSPSISAWRAFEVWDLVLFALALAAIASVVWRPRPPYEITGERLRAIGLAALVIVVYVIVNHPPVAIGRSLQGGAWLGLAGSVAMFVGALLEVARVSVVVAVRTDDPEPTSGRVATPRAGTPRSLPVDPPPPPDPDGETRPLREPRRP